jgi:hypothetical protein
MERVTSGRCGSSSLSQFLIDSPIRAMHLVCFNKFFIGELLLDNLSGKIAGNCMGVQSPNPDIILT